MLSKTVLILAAALAMAMAAPPHEKESHDEAYNSIISQGRVQQSRISFSVAF